MTRSEARSPFLDHEVMEFAARLPVAMKLRGRQSKCLLKCCLPTETTVDVRVIAAANHPLEPMVAAQVSDTTVLLP